MAARVEDNVHEDVKEYYGKTLSRSEDLKTSACTIAGRLKMKKSVRKALAAVHDDVKAAFYGCGLTIPPLVEGCRVLDLGSGSGQDCFAISKLVGAKGSVVGVDMMDEQLKIAYKHEEYHRELFGYDKKNTTFKKGFIEDLKGAGLDDNQFDVIVSNCVVNLSPDKRAVLSEAYRVLKPGGELYFSDIYAENEVPEEIRKNKVLWGECISGALPWRDLISFCKECGFTTPRLVTTSPVNVDDKKLATIVGEVKFVSATYRMFKMATDESNEGSKVTYQGTLNEYEDELPFDSLLIFKTGVSVEVDGELAAILENSRYSSLFQVAPAAKKAKGDCSTTECPTDPFQNVPADSNGSKQDSADGCCGVQSASSGGCAPEKKESSNGSCGAPAKQESCCK